RPATRSTPSSSRPTDTGSAPPPRPPSLSSTLRRRARSTNSSPNTSRRARSPRSRTASAWPGARTGRLCSLDTLTTRSAHGVLCLEHRSVLDWEGKEGGGWSGERGGLSVVVEKWGATEALSLEYQWLFSPTTPIHV